MIDYEDQTTNEKIWSHVYALLLVVFIILTFGWIIWGQIGEKNDGNNQG